MPKIWDVQPLHTSIVEILLKKGGASTDTELCTALEKSRGDMNFRELNRELMRLEVDGVIQVSSLTKNKRRVELVKI